MASTDHRALTSDEKLKLAVEEIDLSRRALLETQARLERITNEKLNVENMIIEERTATQKQKMEIQKSILGEQEVDRILILDVRTHESGTRISHPRG